VGDEVEFTVGENHRLKKKLCATDLIIVRAAGSAVAVSGARSSGESKAVTPQTVESKESLRGHDRQRAHVTSNKNDLHGFVTLENGEKALFVCKDIGINLKVGDIIDCKVAHRTHAQGGNTVTEAKRVEVIPIEVANREAKLLAENKGGPGYPLFYDEAIHEEEGITCSHYNALCYVLTLPSALYRS
jgi:hypothetical protein